MINPHFLIHNSVFISSPKGPNFFSKMYVFRENFPLILGRKVTSKSILRDTQKAQKANIHQRQEDTMQLQEYKNTDS